jgi:hypothetical protein
MKFILIALFTVLLMSTDTRDLPVPTEGHPASGEVEVSVTETFLLPANVVSTYQDINGTWRYQLLATFTDGNNVETVELHEVHQSIVKIKE